MKDALRIVLFKYKIIFIILCLYSCSYEQNLHVCYENNQCTRADFNCVVNYRLLFPNATDIPIFCLIQTKKCKEACKQCSDEIRYSGKTAEYCFRNKYKIANGFKQ